MDDPAAARRRRHQLMTWRRGQLATIGAKVAERQAENPKHRRLKVLSVPPDVADAVEDAVAEAADDGVDADDLDALPADAGL